MQGRDGQHRLHGELSHRTALAVAALLVALGIAAAVDARSARPSYSFAASHAVKRVRQGETAVLKVRFKREHGFRGPLTLGIRHLPQRSRPRWVLPGGRALRRKMPGRRSVILPARRRVALLLVRTTRRTRVGRSRPRLTVTARGQRRFTFLRFRVLRGGPRAQPIVVGSPVPPAPQPEPAAPGPAEAPPAPGAATTTAGGFRLAATLAAPLYPGASEPLDVRIDNPYDFALRLTTLRVTVGRATSRPGCDGASNYRVQQYSGDYPIVAPPGTTQLSALVADARAWPQVSMPDLPVNQDACRGAAFTLSISGVAGQ